MAGTSQVTIPEEFYIKTSDKLLIAPRPRFIFAKWFLDSMALSLGMPAGMGLDGRQIMGQGAAYTQFDQDALTLARDLPSALLAAKIDFRGEPGSTIKLNRPKFVNSTYTTASRRVGRDQTISNQPISVGSEQNNLVLERYSGPYGTDSAGNTGVRPYGIDRFDAGMGVHNLVQVHGLYLMDDFHQFIDAQFPGFGELSTVTSVYADGMTADNDANAADSFPFALLQISKVEESMDTANLPTLQDGFRVMVITPIQWRQLKHDPEYQRLTRYYEEYNIIYGKNYLGSVGKFHLFESNTLLKPLNSSSIPVQHGLALAPSVFLGGSGELPRVGTHTDDNYGERALIVWLAYLAFGLADVNFIRSVRSA